MTTIKSRRDTAAEWTIVNPILAAGENGYELDTGRHKIGDGSTPWKQLDYFIPEDEILELIQASAPENVPNLTLIFQNGLV